MTVRFVVKGVDAFVKSLQARNAAIRNKMEQALLRAGLYLQSESQKLCPVDTGALRNSAFTRKSGTGWEIVVYVGYTVIYAVYVHENLGAKHHVGQAKFLEEPMRTRRKEIMRIIAEGTGS